MDNYEPFPHRQYKCTDIYADVPMSPEKSAQVVLNMYWRGMDADFATLIDTDRDVIGDTPESWLSAYVGYMRRDIVDYHIDIARYADIIRLISRPVSGPYFLVTRHSEAGTSNTGRVIEADMSTFDESLRAKITAARLREYTSARIDGIPSLKSLGIMRVHDLSVHTNHALYCWLYEDEDARDDPNGKPSMYMIRPFNARKPAMEYAESEQSVFNIIPGSTHASTVICLRDIIVKITSGPSGIHVFTKTKKTYYTLSQCPLPPIAAVRLDPNLPRDEITRIAIARCIYGIPNKEDAWLGAYYDQGQLHMCSTNHTVIFSSKTAHIPEKLKPLSRENKEWLRKLSRETHITDVTQARIRLDQLASELI